MSFLNRESRVWQSIPGVGGSLQVQPYDQFGNLLDDRAFFDLGVWRLRNLYINAVTTNSASNGAILRTRVGADWNFVAETQSPVHTYLDLLVGHWRSVAVILNLGDPVWWQSLNLEPRSYRAAKGILDEVFVADDATATAVVEGGIRMSGNSLLVGYLGEVAISPSVWP